jgi:hypothetical protein
MRVAFVVLAVLLAITAYAKKPKRPQPGEFDYATRLGVANIAADGNVCTALKNPKLRAGDPVSIVLPENGTVEQFHIVAKSTKRCLPEASTEPDDISYELALQKSERTELNMPAIGVAVAKYSGPFIRSGDFIGFNSLRLEGEPDFFHSCTSQEGIHVFVWTGLPEKGKLQWHRYFYLGYDVEPTCTEQDFSGIDKK